jgi:hypothetical protein
MSIPGLGVVTWHSITSFIPPAGELILMFTEDELGHRGGIHLGLLGKDDHFYWLKGLEEIRLQDYHVTYWSLIKDPEGYVSSENRRI